MHSVQSAEYADKARPNCMFQLDYDDMLESLYNREAFGDLCNHFSVRQKLSYESAANLSHVGLRRFRSCSSVQISR